MSDSNYTMIILTGVFG